LKKQSKTPIKRLYNKYLIKHFFLKHHFRVIKHVVVNPPEVIYFTICLGSLSEHMSIAKVLLSISIVFLYPSRGSQCKCIIPVKVEREDRIDRFGIDAFLVKLDINIAKKLFDFSGKFCCRP